MLKMEKNQIHWIVRLTTRHCELHGHPYKVDKTVDPTCRRCKKADETENHLLFDFLSQI